MHDDVALFGLVQLAVASIGFAAQMTEVDADDMRVDLHSAEHLHWLNDLETGRQYWQWPSSVMDLLRPTFPGQLSKIAKNLFNVVALLDPGSGQGLR